MEQTNNSFWDAHRLVREYVKVAWMVNGSTPFSELPLNNQVKVQRVASVVCAYLGIESSDVEAFDVICRVFTTIDNREVLVKSEVSADDEATIKQSLCLMSKERTHAETF